MKKAFIVPFIASCALCVSPEVLAVLDRQESGRKAIESHGYRFLSIFTKKDLLQNNNPVSHGGELGLPSPSRVALALM